MCQVLSKHFTYINVISTKALCGLYHHYPTLQIGKLRHMAPVTQLVNDRPGREI